MKASRSIAICLALNCLWAGSSATAQLQVSTNAANVSVSAAEYQCVQRGPHSRVWQCAVLQTNQAGEITTNSSFYTEIATGLCYLFNGQYLDSVEQIDPVADGAQATQGRHQVHWAANGNTPGGAVNLTTPDGKTLLSTVFGLSYMDAATGSNVVLTQAQGSIAVINSNTVTYASAFSNLNADVLYTYRKAGLSQDVILKQQPPSPADYGLNPATSYLQVITEFFNPPAPGQTTVTNNGVADTRQIDFGDMKMGVGHAFLFQSDAGTVGGGSVLKNWTTIENRTFLIESVSYASLSNFLGLLHSSLIKPDKSRVRRTVSFDAPKPRKVSAIKVAHPIKVAKTMSKELSLNIDYELLSSTNNFTFQGDTTYLVSGLCNLSGTNILEGGTVIKYTNNTTAEIEVEAIQCETAEYRPAVFSSMNDDSVGIQISGSTGNPWGDNAGNMALYFSDQTANLQNVRFSHLAAAVSFESGSGDDSQGGYLSMSDFQVVDCQQVVLSVGSTCNLFNGLVYDVGTLFGVYFDDGNNCGQALTAVNLTVHHCGSYAGDQTSYMYFTNCLFAEVTNVYTIPSFTFTNSTYFLSNDTGLFQIVGAGAHYLVDDTYQNAGTTNIAPAQLAELQTKTVYPPVVVPAGWFTNDYTFFPQAQRDDSGSTVAIGYHYDPLDYALNIAVSNAALTVLPGTALAMYGNYYGMGLWSGAILTSLGTATSPNYIVRYNTVQEQSNTNWETASWGESFLFNTEGVSAPVSFRFTEWSVLGQDGQFDAQGPNAYPAAFQDCQFFGGTVTNTAQTLLSTNCLFQRVNFVLNSVGATGPFSNTFCNNLFLEGELSFNHKTNNDTGTWTFRDNLFDQTAITLIHTSSADSFSNNAYVTNCNFVSGVGDVILSNSPAYEIGTLGGYYYPTNLTNLIHTGSRSAPAAGLYHYTVTTNNAIEGTNTVSIGFHYVATTNGVPFDTNGDGIPDYLEDINGNGLVDSGEIAWNVAGDLGLTVWITQPSSNSRLP